MVCPLNCWVGNKSRSALHSRLLLHKLIPPRPNTINFFSFFHHSFNLYGRFLLHLLCQIRHCGGRCLTTTDGIHSAANNSTVLLAQYCNVYDFSVANIPAEGWDPSSLISVNFLSASFVHNSLLCSSCSAQFIRGISVSVRTNFFSFGIRVIKFTLLIHYRYVSHSPSFGYQAINYILLTTFSLPKQDGLFNNIHFFKGGAPHVWLYGPTAPMLCSGYTLLQTQDYLSLNQITVHQTITLLSFLTLLGQHPVPQPSLQSITENCLCPFGYSTPLQN